MHKAKYMNFRSVPLAVKLRVRKYVSFQKHSVTACFFEENSLLGGLSNSLRLEVR